MSEEGPLTSARDVGFDPTRLDAARTWFEQQRTGTARLLVVRNGQTVMEDCYDTDPGARFPIASAAKSVYSNVLGIAIAEGVIEADGRVADVYPAMLEVPEGAGPKPRRYAFAPNAQITFRQLISNVSGYMKPGEAPGQVFHYQSYGMNVLTHAVAAAYGLYDVADPTASSGFAQLIRDKLAHRIGVELDYTLTNFKLQASARLDVFGYYCQIHTTARDFARLGWIWRHQGRWGDEQVVPQDWFDASVRVAPDILAHCPQEHWRYGCGFWTNEHGILWPDLPRTGFTASGAGGHYCSVFPEQDLVVVQNPGPVREAADGQPERGNPDLLRRILEAIA